jgi:hypothetical protein
MYSLVSILGFDIKGIVADCELAVGYCVPTVQIAVGYWMGLVKC